MIARRLHPQLEVAEVAAQRAGDRRERFVARRRLGDRHVHHQGGTRVAAAGRGRLSKRGQGDQRGDLGQLELQHVPVRTAPATASARSPATPTARASGSAAKTALAQCSR